MLQETVCVDITHLYLHLFNCANSRIQNFTHEGERINHISVRGCSLVFWCGLGAVPLRGNQGTQDRSQVMEERVRTFIR